jgi:hypothetical protein
MECSAENLTPGVSAYFSRDFRFSPRAFRALCRDFLISTSLSLLVAQLGVTQA